MKNIMRIYTYDRKDRYYLSPYCRIGIESDRTVLMQTLFDRMLILKAEESLSKKLLDLLSEGCTKEEIRALFHSVISDDETDAFINECLRAGIVE